AAMPPLSVCIQVNVAAESAKGGVAPAALPELAAAVGRLPRLWLRGLMCILPAALERTANRRLFSAGRGCLEQLNAAGAGRAGQAGQARAPLDTLSMGMSGALAEAIAEGATCIRIGTALFGARQRTGQPTQDFETT